MVSNGNNQREQSLSSKSSDLNKPAAQDAATQAPLSWWEKTWREWRGFVVFIFVMLIFRSAVADWNQVPTGSMIPSILEGDRIVVDKLAYDLRIPFTLTRVAKWHDPERSDIITFESPVDGKLLVKRVIGIPGDRVQMTNNKLTINGTPARYESIAYNAVPEPLQATQRQTIFNQENLLGNSRSIMWYRLHHPQIQRTFGPVQVPEGHYLVMGDNRDNSQDYRVIGFVERSLVLGKANSIAFSLDYENYYLPRTDRFLQDLK